MKAVLGFMSVILGMLGIARAGIASPQPAFNPMIGPGFGVASITTLAAVALLVGGLLILAKSGGFPFESSRRRSRPSL